MALRSVAAGAPEGSPGRRPFADAVPPSGGHPALRPTHRLAFVKPSVTADSSVS